MGTKIVNKDQGNAGAKSVKNDESDLVMELRKLIQDSKPANAKNAKETGGPGKKGNTNFRNANSAAKVSCNCSKDAENSKRQKKTVMSGSNDPFLVQDLKTQNKILMEILSKTLPE